MNNLYTSLAQFELMAFFSGYPLIYALVRMMAPVQPEKQGFLTRLVVMSPFAYAVLATLYLGLQLKELSPDYSIAHLGSAVRQNYLKVWGAVGIVFWLPWLSKKPILALGHSLVFVALLVYDLADRLLGFSTDMNKVRNDMNIYTLSLLANVAVYLLVVAFSMMFPRHR